MNARTLGRGLLVAATVTVVATVVAAVVVMGTPAQQRALRLDERRVADLQRVVDAARQHAGRTGALATDLTTLASRPGLRLPITDPDTALPYEYAVQDARTFRVCATFATDTAMDTQRPRASEEEDWLHPAGRHCFDRRWKPDGEAVDASGQA